jgi:hypothetical protein
MQVGPNENEVNKESQHTHEIFNLMAKSIALKKKERESLIEMNQEKFSQSPYNVKKLKVAPNIIYPKNNKDELFMLSEGNRNKNIYTTSH